MDAGYIRGLVDDTRLMAFRATGSAETDRNAMPFCEPPGTTTDAAIGVVVRFMEAPPEYRPLDAAAVVNEALAAE